MKQWLTIICVGFFLLIVGIFFYPTILSGKLPVPADTLIGLYHPWRDLYAATNPRGVPFKNFLITDPVRQQIPWRKVAIDQWKKGQLPLWNPYSFAGTPLAANIQAGVFYPFNFLFFLFDFPIAWTLLIVLQPLLAGLFLFAYLRHHNLHPLASLFGAIAWSFSGFNIAWLTWGTIGHVFLWVPLVLLSLDHLVVNEDKRKLLWWLLGVGGLFMQMVAGHAQIALYGVTLCATYGLWRGWNQPMSKRLILLSVGLAALVATSFQWMPMVRLIVQSGRIGESGWMKEWWFLPWQHLVQFIAPDFFGNPATLNYWGIWNYGEFIGYIGAIPFLFALLSLVGRKSKDGIFWIGVTIVALLFALPTPLAKLPYLMRLPVFSTLQPTRLMAVIDFSLVMLAVYGFDDWLRKKERSNWGAILIVGIIFIALWIIVLNGGVNLQVSKRNLILPTGFFITGSLLLLVPSLLKKYKITYIFGILFIGITALDLLRFGWKFTPFTPKEYFFPQTEAITFLEKQEKPFRVMSTDKRILPPNTSSYYGIETIEGYDPVISERYEELLAAIARGKPDIIPPFGFNRIITLENFDTRLLRLLGVRYILSLEQLVNLDIRQIFVEGNTRVYEIIDSAPRVYLAERYLERKEKQDIIEAIFDPLFQPGKHAVVEKRIPVLNSSPLHTSDYVNLVSYLPSSMELSVRASGISRLLVILNTYAPGWRAYIDGNPQEVLRVNYIFQGVVVPEGTHRVSLSFGL